MKRLAVQSTRLIVRSTTLSRDEHLVRRGFDRLKKRAVRERPIRQSMVKNRLLYNEQQKLIIEKGHKVSSVESFFDVDSIAKITSEGVPLFDEFKQSQGDSLLYSYTMKSSRSWNNDRIQNSILCLATHLINTFIVEITLRRQLLPEDPIQKVPTSFLFRENVLSRIKDSEKQMEIFQILKVMKESRQDPSSDPPSVAEFLKSLDQKELRAFVDGAKSSLAFHDARFWRYNFIHTKSGQHLNYDRSDTFQSIQGLQLVRFQSPVVDNAQIIANLDKIFDTFNIDGNHQVLLLSIASTLLGTHPYTPNYAIFDHLLAKSANIPELRNFQSIVYDSLWLNEHRQSVLAAPSPDGARQGYHFKHLIEDNANTLKTLIRYQVLHGDIDTFTHLLGFYRLEETQKYEKSLLKTSLTGLVSQSRFSAKRSVQFRDVDLSDSGSLVVDVETLYCTIEACLDLEQYAYIDLLISKLVLFGNTDGTKIALSLNGLSDKFSLMLTKKLTPSECSLKIFTKQLFLLLFRACRDAKDAGRLLWLIPHLDLYIETNLKNHKATEHIQRIKHFYRESLLEGNYNNATEFDSFEKSSAFDTEFIESVYKTLKMFAIDGKIHSYNKHFDFDNVIADKVKCQAKHV